MSITLIARGSVLAAVGLAAGLIASYEGFRQVGYLDPVGIATACWGHTGRGVSAGVTYSEKQCADWLRADVAIADNAVSRCITKPMTHAQRVAFTSFAYNVGEGAFCRSNVALQFNRDNVAGACARLDQWVYAKGIKLPGLVKRRAHERALCEGKANE